MEHRERLEQIWSRLWVLIPNESSEAVAEKEKLIAEMDELDPAGIGILESLREDEMESHGRNNAEHMD